MRLIDADVVMAKLTPEDWRTPDERWMPERQIGAMIQNAPTIDAVHGEWTEKEVIQDKVIEEWQSARCSNCGKYHTTPYMYYFDDFDFCPNCGARMKGE